MSNTEFFCVTKNSETASSCNDSLKLKQQTALEKHSCAPKCRARKLKEQEYLREVWSVQQVPHTFDGLSKPSAAVDRLLSLKKADHDAALKSFKTEIDCVHKTCNDDIEELKKHLQVDIDSLHVNIENQKREFCEMKCVTREQHEELKIIVESIMNEERAIIEDLLERIKVVETKRQGDTTHIFKKYYLILRQLFYLSSNDLKTLMENKIMEYNQMALSNHKKYEDFKLKLLLSADVFKQKFYVWLKEIKKNRSAVCRKIALNDFYTEYENFQNAGSVYLGIIEGKAAIRRLQSRKNVIPQIVAEWDLTIPFAATRFGEQSYQLDTAISSIDTTVADFIKSYKFYMSRHLGRVLNKLNKLKSIIEGNETTEEGEEQEDEDCKGAQDTYDKAKEQLDSFVADLEVSLSTVLDKLRSKAKEIMKPFEDFGSPWDVQFASFSKCQDSVIQQLQNRAVKAELVHRDFQEKINIEIIKLREEDTVPKLDKRLGQIFAILNKKIQKYNKDFEEDCKIVRKCKEGILKEVVAMQSKIEKFLQANNVSVERAESKSSYESHDNDCYCDLSLEEIILREMELMEKQTDSLDNWKSEFLNSISSYLSLFEKDILEVVQSWEEQLVNEASQCLEENLKFAEQWREDIRKDYDVRLKDLICHQQQLERHKKMISAIISERSECIATFLDFTGFIEDYTHESTQMVDEYGSKIKNSCQIKCLQNMLRQLKRDYKSKIELRTNFNTEILKAKIFLMKNRNESFMGKIKSFQNYGNYGLEEVNLAKKETTILSKSIQKDEYDNRTKIKKASDQANSEIEKTEKSYFESLNITMQKLKIQEDVYNAMTKCEYLIRVRMKQLIDMNNETVDGITSFIDKCQNKLTLDEITLALSDLIKTVEKNFKFLKGPFPNLEIPLGVEKYTAELESNTAKGKKNKLQKRNETVANEKSNTVNDKEETHDAESFALIIVKLIQDALLVVNDRAKNFYTTLINKKENPAFPDKNKDCEDCINYSLEQLNVLHVIAFNCWMDETNKFLNFFYTLEMPSIDWYLIEESMSEEKSSESHASLDSDPNNLSSKVDKNFAEFQKILQEMLHLLRSKNKTAYEKFDYTENLI